MASGSDTPDIPESFDLFIVGRRGNKCVVRTVSVSADIVGWRLIVRDQIGNELAEIHLDPPAPLMALISGDLDSLIG